MGPRNGLRERITSSPLSEYVTGVLAPKSSNIIREIDQDSDIPYRQSDYSAEDIFDEDVTGPESLSPALNPKRKPSSIGISFVVQSTSDYPSIEVCATWARYITDSDNGWTRFPHYLHERLDLNFLEKKIFYVVDEGNQAHRTEKPSIAEICLHIICRKLDENLFLINVYLVNGLVQSGRFLTTVDHIFQPQIRIRTKLGTVLQPGLNNFPQDQAGEELAFLYRNKPVLARGHLCSATWEEIDPERENNSVLNFAECINQPPFYWLDGEIVEEAIRGKFSPPKIRTEFIPIYSILSPKLEWDDSLSSKPTFSATVLSETWNGDQLVELLKPITLEYQKWIDELEIRINELSSFEKEIASRALEKCKKVNKRIDEGIKILQSNENARLAFCFANKAISLQNYWKSKNDLEWYPFQLAFILLTIESIVNPSSEDRNTCDVLWVPTGAGKTEAYLGIAAFVMAYRRRMALVKGNQGNGVSVISRYTLRLLTIQQFRRALKMITASEFLRVYNLTREQQIGWKPKDCSISGHFIWGVSRFSIGMWVGGAVTPNRLQDIWAGNRNLPGAISLLSGDEGPGEPAQILSCPACETILSVPETGLQAGVRSIYWVVRSEVGLETIKGQLLDIIISNTSSVNITEIDVTPNDSSTYYTISIKLSCNNTLSRSSINRLWRQIQSHVQKIELIAVQSYHPGYFLRWYLGSRNQRKQYDFEILCPNPNCPLHKPWCEMLPMGSIFGTNTRSLAPNQEHKIHKINDQRLVHINHAFCLNSPFISDRVPIPAYSVDEQVYSRIPSMLIGTVDKFARPPFDSRSASIFGNIDFHNCITGYYRDPIDDHPPPTGRINSRCYKEIEKVEPPNLIIQDELHLIEGPLGSLVGIYETAMDYLCTNNKKTKYIASTATIRNSEDQVLSLFARDVLVFPSSAYDSDDRFFIRFDSDNHQLNDVGRGRLYVGVMAPGRGPLLPTYRIWARIMHTAWIQRNHALIDPYWTLVGYFNAVRELGGVRALYWQDLPGRLNQISGGNSRQIPDLNAQELSSNTISTNLPSILDLLNSSYPSPNTQDALFTTSMFGTGIDIPRLSLMIVHGQPKTTSAYIQSTGRVGRRGGGLVVVFLRSTRPRDLNHYEFFNGYHQQLHRFVEPVTVSPYAPGVIERALGPLAVFILRNSRNVSNRWRINDSAPDMATLRLDPDVTALANLFETRAQNQPISRKPPSNYVLDEINRRLDDWQQIAVRNFQNLKYVEYAISRRPTSSVVLGDAQHQHAGLEVVFPNAPQSLRDVEETTGFQT